MNRRLVGLLAAIILLGGLATTSSNPANAGDEYVVGGAVTPIGHIGEPGMVSGRIVDGISEIDGEPTRFLVTHGPRGISVYDLRIPERPLLAGHLPLPHYYTEDMDLGGDVLIVAVDPGWTDIITSPGTVGGLYIVDVSNLPQLGLHYTNPLTANLWKEPVRRQHSNGGGHTVSCVNEDCTYAYVNGTNKVTIIDLHDPSDPQVVRTFYSPVGSTHDIQIDSDGYAWMVGSGGIVAYDVTDPINPVHVTRKSRGGLGYHHNSQRRDDVVLITEESVYPALDHTVCNNSASFGTGQGRFQTRQIVGGDGTVGTGMQEDLQVLDTWETELQVADRAGTAVVWCSAHYFDESDGMTAIAWYEQGLRFLDTSDPSNIRQVGYFIPPGTEVWDAKWIGPGAFGGEIVYTFDYKRGIDIVRVDRDGSLPLPTVEAPILDSWVTTDPVAAQAFEDELRRSVHRSPDGTLSITCRIPGLDGIIPAAT